MADIHKYQTERHAAGLARVRSDATRLEFQITCQTDPELYDQPLTLELGHPRPLDVSRVAIKDARGQMIPARAGDTVIRFDVAPRDATYYIEMKP